MPGCPQLGANSAFLTGVLEHVDCQARTIGESGYQALAAPGSSVGLILTGLITLFIALHGYRMILGQTPTPREGVIAVVKIGLVLALATSWATYRTLVYDVTLRAPAELAAEIGRPAGLPGTGGAMTAWLQSADDALLALAVVGPDPQPAGQTVAPPPRPANGLARRVDPIADATMLGYARVLFLTGAIGAFASVRLVGGLLLAIGPLFVAFLLFGGTRGLFEGWLRGLVGVALGALGTTIVLGVELALLVPWLAALIAERRMGGLILGAQTEILVLTLVFALALLATLVAAARVAMGLKLPRELPAAMLPGGRPALEQAAPVRGANVDNPAKGERSRALVIADAIAAAQGREGGGNAAPSTGQSDRHTPREAVSRDVPAPPPTPLGQTFRRTRSRISAGAARRDHAA